MLIIINILIMMIMMKGPAVRVGISSESPTKTFGQGKPLVQQVQVMMERMMGMLTQKI